MEAANESRSEFLFRNICALLTLIIAVYFVYSFLGLSMLTIDRDEFINNMAENYGTSWNQDAVNEVLLEDFGIGLGLLSFDFGGIIDKLLILVCIALCVFSNISHGKPIKHFCRTSVGSTAITVVAGMFLGTPVSAFFASITYQFYAWEDPGMFLAASAAPFDWSYFLAVFFVSLGALIPAFIARKKHYSFVKYFLLGLFGVIPALLVILCKRDKYDELRLESKFVSALLTLAGTVILTMVLIQPVYYKVEEYAEARGEILDAANFASSEFVRLVIYAVIALIVLSFAASILIVRLLQRPLEMLSAKLGKKKKHRTYTGRNAGPINEIYDALPYAKKHELFFKKRDKLARYKNPDIDMIMAYALPWTLVAAAVLIAAYHIFGAYVLPAGFNDGFFPWREYLLTLLSLFVILVALYKPISVIKVKKAERMDEVSEHKGYMAEIRQYLPSFSSEPDENIRYAKLRNMPIILRFTNEGTTIGSAINYSTMIEEGKSLAKVIAVAAAAVVAAKALNDSANQ